MPQSGSTGANTGGNANADSYIEYLIGALQELMAAGITGNSGETVDALYADLQARQAAAGTVDFNVTQAWARQPTYA
jgi:hypothetical protein